MKHFLSSQYNACCTETGCELSLTGDWLAKISILVSNHQSPTDPSLNSLDWTRKNYHEYPYGDVGRIEFWERVEAQHIAVLSENNQPLTLVEVEVLGKFRLSGDITTENRGSTCRCKILLSNAQLRIYKNEQHSLFFL